MAGGTGGDRVQQPSLTIKDDNQLTKKNLIQLEQNATSAVASGPPLVTSEGIMT